MGRMRKRNQRKRQHQRPASGRVSARDELRDDADDKLIEKIAALSVIVEAAGRWQIARCLLVEYGFPNDPEQLDAMQGFVPARLGGTNTDPKFDPFWRDIFDRGMQYAAVREVYALVQASVVQSQSPAVAGHIA